MQARDIVGQALVTAMHAMQVMIATTLGTMPGALAFSRDMFLNVPLIADWQTIARHCEQCVNDNLCAMQIGSNVNMTMLQVRKF